MAALRYFEEEFISHIVDKRCSAGACKPLVRARCTNACPAEVDVPSYIALVAQGRYAEGLEIHRRKNPFALVCGRVCPAFCEQRCRRADIDEPIAIRAAKRYMADHEFEKIESKVDSDKIEHEWELKVDEKLFNVQEYKERKNYSNPYYYFVVETAGMRQRSGLLKYKDWIELELKDDDGKPIGGAEYQVHLPNGEIRRGNLDQNGTARVENIPPSQVKVIFDAG